MPIDWTQLAYLVKAVDIEVWGKEEVCQFTDWNSEAICWPNVSSGSVASSTQTWSSMYYLLWRYTYYTMYSKQFYN